MRTQISGVLVEDGVGESSVILDPGLFARIEPQRARNDLRWKIVKEKKKRKGPGIVGVSFFVYNGGD